MSIIKKLNEEEKEAFLSNIDLVNKMLAKAFVLYMKNGKGDEDCKKEAWLYAICSALADLLPEDYQDRLQGVGKILMTIASRVFMQDMDALAEEEGQSLLDK